MTDPHLQIADLEAEIDSLSEAREQCRKSMTIAKLVAGAGILLFGAALGGLLRPDPLVLVFGIAGTLAGIGLYGSSRGSLEQITGKIRALECERARVIDAMDLQPVQDY